MVDCKKCLHAPVCEKRPKMPGAIIAECSAFKDRAKWAERPKGRWVSVVDFGGGNCYGYCSNCMTVHKAYNATALRVAYRYCHWCGADMRGESE